MSYWSGSPPSADGRPHMRGPGRGEGRRNSNPQKAGPQAGSEGPQAAAAGGGGRRRRPAILESLSAAGTTHPPWMSKGRLLAGRRACMRIRPPSRQTCAASTSAFPPTTTPPPHPATPPRSGKGHDVDDGTLPAHIPPLIAIIVIVAVYAGGYKNYACGGGTSSPTTSIQAQKHLD